jgi:gamma-tubulin complex component 2
MLLREYIWLTVSIDPSLCNLVERILPLATYYTGVMAFIEARSHLDLGLVNHALCAAMREVLKVSFRIPLLRL